MKRSLTFLLLPFLSFTLPAHGAAGANLVSNGGFEQVTVGDNLWDGVDSDGYLAGWRGSATTLNPYGGRADLAMPVSVACGDLNGDGITDIMTADPFGFYRIYFGSGTPQDPKYTHCEMVPLYISRENHAGEATRIPKIALYDWSKRGLLDLLVGDYQGRILLIPNTGSAQVPEFRQPDHPEHQEISTSKANRLWCILPAPAVWDFNGDGKPDLLLGEGSYSANAIHLLINKSASNVPQFDETGRCYLVYGDGREVLTPTVIDYNGDGQMDVAVGASDGKVCVYLNPGNWKPGTEFKMASEISFGGSTTIGGVVAPFAADINHDGLPDLLIGKNNGRIALAINKGTKEQPKFDRPVEIQGEDVWKRDINTPVGWSTSDGVGKGNLYGRVTSVSAEEDKDAQPAEGARALKFGYNPSLNKIVKIIPLSLDPKKPPMSGDWFPQPWHYNSGDANFMGEECVTNLMGAKKDISLPVGKSYTISFKVKGRNFTNGHWLVAEHGYGLRSPKKITRGERGSANVQADAAIEVASDAGTLNPGTSWSTVTKTLDLHFKHCPELNLQPDEWGKKFKGMSAPTYHAFIYFCAEVRPPDGAVYIDDVSITEKTQ